MADGKGKIAPRTDRELPGVWRLRMPLPWPGVPHGNAWAIAAGGGGVVVDAGIHAPGGQRQLELALQQAGLRIEHIRLVVCTHPPSDHYGLAKPIVEATGSQPWLHPALAHMRNYIVDPEGAFERRLEGARRNGVPQETIDGLATARGSQKSGVAGLVEPDVELVDGVEVRL